MSEIPQVQRANAVQAKRTPYVEITTNVFPPEAGEILIRVEWTASSPLDLHRADGGLIVEAWPLVTGSGGVAGTVVAVGSSGVLKGLQIGDRVMSFAFRGEKEANHQEYITIPAYLASKIPDCLSMQEAVTIPVNLCTVFHTVITDLGVDLPWPIPDGWVPAEAEKPFLIWGGSSSVGTFAVQVLRHWGFKKILVVASGKHHEHLRSLGATACFDYTKPKVVETILGAVDTPEEPIIPYIIDCIGSMEGSLRPLTRIAQRDSKVSVMLPVIIKDATEEDEPLYEMDVSKCHPDEWAPGVILKGVRTHHYLEVSERCFYPFSMLPDILNIANVQMK